MAYYLVRADLKVDLSDELRAKLDRGAFRDMRPFGQALTTALEGAKRDNQTGQAVWEEEDYCSPPLAMERAAVLDRYFNNLSVERVTEDEGWKQIADLPSLWQKQN